ncbi:ABC transporter substrate-binding protein [Brevibacillus invocatus]|uniref:ABC transporter substrate-binding protein n=1 Tax=Brevibacillus invocatus TaxID=173959 RepID=UPI00203AF315|nr:ABC transporter substrate-binding protein [Brevibacillus invocatus]MCM3431804.1 ABC transporter substrate-binding protein [Brevibacillus invocatus]
MQIVLHYLELSLFFRDQSSSVQTPLPVTVEKLSGVWHCTPRYVKLIVRKLCDLNWIDWQAGKGRGHSSVLTMQKDADELLQEVARSKVEQGEVKEAMNLMSRFGTAVVKKRFMEWLSQGMGFSTKTVSDRLQDTLRLPVYRAIYTLDPANVYYAFDCHMTSQIFNTLVEYDHASKTIVPCMAHSWEVSQDAREWIFHLKKGILFHHERELTAHDVVYSLNRFRLNPKRYPASWMFQDVEQLEAIDPKTVRIHLQKPNYFFLRFLCAVYASIVPEEIAQKEGTDFSKQPIGTGSFRLVQRDDGICILEAFSSHFRGRPLLDRVEVLILPEMDEGCLKEPDWTSVRTSHGDTSIHSAELADDWCGSETVESCSTLLVFNQWKSGPQNHRGFREALHHILDRRQMIEDLQDNLMLPYPAKGSRTPLSESEPVTEDGLPDIDALLASSGYQGEPFHLTTNTQCQPEAEWIQQRCQSFGIHVVIQVDNAIHAPIHSAYDARLFGFVSNMDDESLLEAYQQENYLLPAFDEEMKTTVNELVQSIMRDPNEREQKRKLADLEEHIRETHSILFLVCKKSSASYHKSVRGVTINSYGWIDFHKIWFQPQALRST